YNRCFGKEVRLAKAAEREIENYPWDGNIRQLRNFCERLTAIATEPVVSAAVARQNFQDSFWTDGHPQDETPAIPGKDQPPRAGQVLIRGVLYTRPDLLETLARFRGNREAVARHLGVSRTTLWKYLKELGISRTRG
ncbi:MAG: hypothetical protein LIP77_09555, partial [Planctomycetes bacterium]|nr:hypothetical protein [Planctomycetota bacterium]